MIHWITDRIGTAARDLAAPTQGVYLLDVRDLLDRGGNSAAAMRCKLDQGIAALRAGQKVLVCCDEGISRSAVIAAGLLAQFEGMPFDEAVRRVLNRPGEVGIRIELLSVMRAVLGQEHGPQRPSTGPSRRILVTGGAGFIGSALVRTIGDRMQVSIPSRGELDLREGSVPLDLWVRDWGIDTIVHLAHPRLYTSSRAMGESVEMLRNVLDVAVHHRTYLVYLSSWEVFSGYESCGLRADESLPPRPRGADGEAKFLCESLIDLARVRHALPVLVLRSGPVYGSGSARPRFMWTFLEKALEGREIVTHRYRNGFPTLDLMHVRDLCRGLALALERRTEGLLHLGTGRGISTAEIARWIVGRVGSRSPIRHEDVEGYAANIMMDTHLAREVLGWTAEIPIEQGLEEILAVRGVPDAPGPGRDRIESEQS